MEDADDLHRRAFLHGVSNVLATLLVSFIAALMAQGTATVFLYLRRAGYGVCLLVGLGLAARIPYRLRLFLLFGGTAVGALLGSGGCTKTPTCGSRKALQLAKRDPFLRQELHLFMQRIQLLKRAAAFVIGAVGLYGHHQATVPMAPLWVHGLPSVALVVLYIEDLCALFWSFGSVRWDEAVS